MDQRGAPRTTGLHRSRRGLKVRTIDPALLTSRLYALAPRPPAYETRKLSRREGATATATATANANAAVNTAVKTATDAAANNVAVKPPASTLPILRAERVEAYRSGQRTSSLAGGSVGLIPSRRSKVSFAPDPTKATALSSSPPQQRSLVTAAGGTGVGESAAGDEGGAKSLADVVLEQTETGLLLRKLRDELPHADKSDPLWFVEHLLKNPDSLEFVYLKPVRKGSPEFNPYKVAIVSHAGIDSSDYFTLSSSGVTHFVEGVAEFVPLVQWLREYLLYSRIKRIPIFDKYRMWKSYTMWRGNVWSKKSALCRSILSQHLFIANDILGHALRKLRSLCYELSQERLHRMAPGTTLTLEMFVVLQDEHREYLLERLATFNAAVEATVAEACEYALSRAGFDEEQSRRSGGRAQHASAGQASSLDARLGASSTSDGPAPGDSLGRASLSDSVAPLSYTFLAAKRTECRRLANFIKLADYLIIDTLHQLAVNTVWDLLQAVMPDDGAQAAVRARIASMAKLVSSVAGGTGVEPGSSLDPQEINGAFDERSSLLDAAAATAAASDLTAAASSMVTQATAAPRPPLFRIALELKYSELAFAPDRGTFHDAIDSIIRNFQLVILSNMEKHKLIKNKEFLARYVTPTLSEQFDVSEVGDGPVLLEVLEGDSKYQRLLAHVKDSLAKSFIAASDYLAVFEPFWTIHRSAELMDISLVEARGPPLQWFAASMTRYRAQMSLMGLMPVSSSVGIIQIDSSALKASFAPSPAKCLAVLEDLLPRLASDRNSALLTRLNAAHARLDAVPTKVEHFVEKLAYLETLTVEQDELEDEEDLVKAMYGVIVGYRPEIHNLEEYASFRTLAPLVQSLKAKIAFAEEEREKNIQVFATQLEKKIAELRNLILDVKHLAQHERVLSDASGVAEMIDYVSTLTARIKALKEQASKYIRFQKTFKVPVSKFEELEETMSDLALKEMLWSSFAEWEGLQETWRSTPFDSIDAAALASKVQHFVKVCMKLERGLPPNPVVPKLRDLVDDFQIFVPIIVNLRNSALQLRHWEDIQEKLGSARIIARGDDFTLGSLLMLDVLEAADRIQQVSLEATNEANLTEMLEKVQSTWANEEFIVLRYRDSRDMYILGSTEEIAQALEDSLILVSTVLGSRYVGPIKPEAEAWDRNLRLFKETLEAWLVCQAQWMYFETIFSNSEIVKQLYEEEKMFREVHRSWNAIMRRVQDGPRCLDAVLEPGMLEQLRANNRILEQVQASLESKLEGKRSFFPRFYFLSNDELLEILAESKNPAAVQPHLLKCFSNVAALEFSAPEPSGRSSMDIVALVSSEGERLVLTRSVKTRSEAVESWLSKVEEAMRSSLKKRGRDALTDYLAAAKPREQWIFDHCAQLVLAISQVLWAREVEASLRADNTRNALNRLKEKSFKQLSALALLVQGELTKLQRKALGSLLTIEVHSRDIVSSLWAAKVADDSAFLWKKQLRYYWDSEAEELFMEQTNARFEYGYEYLGCSPRLVITPLTDRCYLTLTGAMALNMGGSPAGPAGTGKTETVKDLAKALAIQCVVFNCSESLEVAMMGRYFAGLAQSGAWCCFDEFNRIEVEVLSVIATQILTIQRARVAPSPDGLFEFEGRRISLNDRCAYFITMNPSYTGRTELPDNLAALFRPVAMMIPDYAMIAEIVLYAEGFESATVLSRKMTQLYRLCSEQLSQQDHYDFGMRAIKSVLVMAGTLKRSNPQLDEDVVLIRALRDSNVPKFLAEDLPLFQGILADLFPGLELPDEDFGDLVSAVESAALARGLEIVDKQIVKVRQLWETLCVRHGVMVVGKSGGGKSVAVNVLADALDDLASRPASSASPLYTGVTKYVLNPKAVTMDELYGHVDLTSREYTPGLIGNMVSAAVKASAPGPSDSPQGGKSSPPKLQWVVFDGPVDSKWIENMNTVLDDNKLLCLPNSARINLTPSIRLLFEVLNLAKASPATVSRCGMVYLEPVDLGWEPPVRAWLRSQATSHIPLEVKDRLAELFAAHVPPGLDYIRQYCTEEVVSCDASLVAGVVKLLTGLLTPHAGFDPDADSADAVSLAEDIFVFAFVWGLGGNLAAGSREGFDAFVQEAFADVAAIPGTKTVYHYFVDPERKSFAPWDDLVPEFSWTPGVPFWQMLVPTAETVCMQFLLNALVPQGGSGPLASGSSVLRGHVLINGATGTGKTVVVQNWLRQLAGGAQQGSFASGGGSMVNLATGPSSAALASGGNGGMGRIGASWQTIAINFSAQTSSQRTQLMIENKLEKRRAKDVLRGMNGKRVVLFVDDINMPAVDPVSDSQPAIELLRQYLDYGGWYDRPALFWKRVEDVTLVGSCGPPGGGRNPMSERFKRHFFMLNVPPTDVDSLFRIFHSILSGFLGQFPSEVAASAAKVVKASVELYSRVRAEMLPTPSKSHYTFNLRDLSKVVQGVLQTKPGYLADAPELVSLWAHESMRVFHDRLTCVEDRDAFLDLVVALIRRHFGLRWETNAVASLMFGDFMRVGATPEERVYEGVAGGAGSAKVVRTLEEYLDRANMDSGEASVELVFFKDAIDHVSRIARILRQPRGNALLVGVSGTGKRTLTRLAAAMAEYQVFEIKLTRSYARSDFREDLRQLYTLAGVARENVVFLLNDTQIVDEAFLEDINGVLNTGEVPSLFVGEEYETVINKVRPFAVSEGRIAEKDRAGIFEYFIKQVREKLHVVLCMSPIGKQFRRRLLMFPSLVSCCTIDWVDVWSGFALERVGQHRLTPAAASVVGAAPGLAATLAKLCVSVHASVEAAADAFYAQMGRRFYVTPASYLAFLDTYGAMLARQQAELGAAMAKFAGGTAKLRETNELVAEMQITLQQMQPELEEKAAATQALMEKVAQESEVADGIRRRVAAEEVEVNEQTLLTKMAFEDAERDLSKVQPMMDAAEDALEVLNPADISEVKSYANPSPAVIKVMNAVLITLGSTNPTWPDAKRLLGEPHFLRSLRELDKTTLPPAVLGRLKKYLNDPEFDEEYIKSKGSMACSTLVLWVKAVSEYVKVYAEVEPKRVLRDAAQEKLAEMMAKLQEKQAKLAQVEDELATLRDQYQATLNELEEVERVMGETRVKLERAGKLVNELAGEAVRWEESLERVREEASSLVGDVFLASAGLAYFGPFTQEWRAKLWDQWLGFVRASGLKLRAPPRLAVEAGVEPEAQDAEAEGEGAKTGSGSEGGDDADADADADAGVDADADVEATSEVEATVEEPASYAHLTLTSILAKPVTIRNWNLQGLPTDEFSAQNAVLATLSGAFPLMIDPQGQANKWVRSMEEESGLVVVKLGEPDLLRSLETAVRQGLPVLIEDVGEELDPALDSLLLKQFTHQGPRVLVKVGDAEVDYDPGFRLYMTTKLSNPHYLPEVCIKVALINFTVTLSGLEDQLLGDVVSLEAPELEAKRVDLIVSLAADKAELEDIENNILRLLANAEGVLEDEVLVNTLQAAKASATSIAARVIESERVEKEVELARDQYRSVAVRGAVLFFVLVDLSKVESMYDYALSLFKERMFLAAIRATVTPADGEGAEGGEGETQALETRLTALLGAITSSVFVNVSRGLFVEHKLLFSSLIAVKVLVHAGAIRGDELNFLLRAGAREMDKLPAMPRAPNGLVPAWLTAKMWALVSELEQSVANFAGFSEQVAGELAAWESFVHSPDPMRAPVPVSMPLNAFQKLLVLRVFRPDALARGMASFVSSTLGAEFAGAPAFALSEVADESSRARDEDELYDLSLGKGQGPIAEDLIARAAESGGWVFLQNCHLASSWMPELERLVNELASGVVGEIEVHPRFRLWLSSLPSGAFPVPVLQSSLKITFDPPRGIKANLLAALGELDEEEFDSGSPTWRNLSYAVSSVYAILLERKEYGPLGFNISYGWSSPDLRTAFKVVRSFLDEEAGVVPRDALTYLLGDIVLGGRVTDDLDRRLVQTLIESVVFSTKSPAPRLAAVKAHVESHWDSAKDAETVGLHENSVLTRARAESLRLLADIAAVQPRQVAGDDDPSPKPPAEGGAGAEAPNADADDAEDLADPSPKPPSDQDVVKEIAAELEGGLPSELVIDRDSPLFSVPGQNRVPALSVVLAQEAARLSRFVGDVRAKLVRVQDAVSGRVVFDDELEDIFIALRDGRVPQAWLESCPYSSTLPLFGFFADLSARVAFFRDWLESGKTPSSFWLPAFTFPQGFLSGVLQHHVRVSGHAIDELEFDVRVVDGSMGTPDEGVVVHGLWLEGARWDDVGNVLTESQSGKAASRMPSLWLRPVVKPAVAKAHTNRYDCPVYCTSLRKGRLSTTGLSSNYVMSVSLPVRDGSARHWILRGVALVLTVNET
ncbi:dynein heavy chain [Thecamonas trahens ATCC 50062]|uniref:Dynein heavy chain n=1 Tax=Thecamonas trahens ATCC 50062 TaxID=461836 RepID=A0A0L0DTI3_THETB|nr:dynein heavy chain [Thecamonas trahens ATCC 50062]KNC55366.1 dynein heavy chain [Thecamonas trahens ATCC 50062]|eukprot:XP_013753000.1 dynein heavy chain [Thecamonas trahens ATCC 50062]